MRSVLLASITFLFCLKAYSATSALPDVLTPNELASELGILDGAGQDIRFLKSSRLQIMIHKALTNETLVVTLDGKQLESWPTSTGRDQWETSPSGKHYFTSTPDGHFRIFKMVADYHSQTWGNAEMTNAMFFDGGIAIHGIKAALAPELGTPASGGCVRLSIENAKTLWDQVVSVGVRNVLVIVITDTAGPIPAPVQPTGPTPTPTPQGPHVSPSPTLQAPNWP